MGYQIQYGVQTKQKRRKKRSAIPLLILLTAIALRFILPQIQETIRTFLFPPEIREVFLEAVPADRFCFDAVTAFCEEILTP